MSIRLPDATLVAREMIERATHGRHQFIDGPVDRVLADAPWADGETLFSGLAAFHRERLERVPSAVKYPEARPWVEHRLAVERELVAAGVSDWDRAVLGGLNDYLAFRGYRRAALNRASSGAGAPGPQLTEKCRIAFVPDTDQGTAFIINVDDPATFWRKDPTPPSTKSGIASTFWQPLKMSGVGSGLHLDLEPEELFPLPVMEMYGHCCDDLDGAVQFLTRYGRFFSGGNFIIHDRYGHSVAIEKCSRNYIEVFHPTVAGRSHVSGMVCRDPDSPQGRHQRAMREEYVRLSGRGWDAGETFDVAFWDACDLAERILADFLADPGPVTVEALQALFTTPFPQGLRKDGGKFHPDQGYLEYTLITYIALLEKRQVIRFQCDDPPSLQWPAEPEIYQV
ncbi:MAG: hypothetical protein ACYDCO_15180 [Armatimonadota bacterium]